MSETESVDWYWVAATYKAIIHNAKASRRVLWERTVFLMHCPDPTRAMDLAREIASLKEHEYDNCDGDRVSWVLQDIEEIQKLHESEFKNGTEVYWKFYHKMEPER